MLFENVFVFSNLVAMIVVVAGGIVRGYTGFGSGLVIVPLLAFLWDPVNAIVLTVSLGLFATIQTSKSALKQTNWKVTIPMISAALIATPLGTFLLITLDPEIVRKIIAGIVLLVTVISLAGWSYKGPTGAVPSFITGAVASVINGVAAVGGPVHVLYLISLPERPEIQRANMTIMTNFMGTIVLIYTLIAGEVSFQIVERIILFSIPFILSVWLGVKLFKLIPGESFKTIILCFLVLIVSGILFV